jgi:hypothetical protein
MDHYAKYLMEYEELEFKINQKLKEIPKDVFTEADQEAIIQQHFKEENETEKELGNRFKVKKVEEGGSLLESVNRRTEGTDMVGQFWKDIEHEFGAENPEEENDPSEIN